METLLSTISQILLNPGRATRYSKMYPVVDSLGGLDEPPVRAGHLPVGARRRCWSFTPSP